MIARVISSRLLLQMQGSSLILASAIGAASGGTLLLLSSTETVAALAIILIGLSFAGIFPTTLGLAAGRFEAYSGTVFGILFAIALTGGMTLPWAVGQIAQAHGLHAALILVVTNGLMIFFLQLVISRLTPQA